MAALVAVVMALLCLSMKVIGLPKLVIDQDGGADDVMAVFMALLHEQYFNGSKVLAVTTTHGNIPEEQVFLNTQRLLDIAGRRDVPIYRGSKSSLVVDTVTPDYFFGRDGLGDASVDDVEPIKAQPGHAALGLIHLTNTYPGEITVVTLGTLTNIALAIRLDPAFLSRVATLFVAVGRDKKNLPNYNIEQDVEAYYVVIQNATPDKVTIVSYPQIINITKEWRVNVLGAIQSKKMEALNRFERVSLPTQEWWLNLDPVAMAAFLNNTVVRDVKYSKHSVTLCGDRRALLVNDFTTRENANVKVIREIYVPKYQDVILSMFKVEQ